MRSTDISFFVKIRLSESFLSNLLGNLLFPFLIPYFAEIYGEAVAGALLVTTSLTAIFSGLYGGYLADHYGKRKLLICAEWVRLLAILTMWIGSSHRSHSDELILCMLVINSLCMGISSPASQALLTDAATPENRRLVYSISYWATNGAMLVGSILGGFLFQSYRSELFLALAGGSLLSLILLYIFIDDQPVRRRAHETYLLKGAWKAYRAVLQDRAFLLFAIASLLVISIQFQGRNYLGIHLAKNMELQTLRILPNFRLQLDGYKMFGFLIAENSFLVLALGTWIPRWTRNYRDSQLLWFGILLHAMSFGGLFLVHSPLGLLLWMVPITIGELLLIPARQSLLMNLLPADRRSSYLAVYNLVYRGAVLLGAQSVIIGTYIPAWAMSILLILTGLISIYLFKGGHPKASSLGFEQKTV